MKRRLRILHNVHKFNQDELFRLIAQPITIDNSIGVRRLNEVLSKLSPRLRVKHKAITAQQEFDFNKRTRRRPRTAPKRKKRKKKL